MDEQPQGEKPKIIIDEDWKTQVQAEKAAAKQGDPAAGEPAAPGEPPQAADQTPPGAADFPDDPEMPPASFEMLLTGLATEAMMSLGQIPNPITGEAKVRRNQAKYLIDTIGVLQERTKGNVSPEEAQAIDGLLHQLRMAYVRTPSA
ncbi:hypothetical protein Pla123a_38490 [Posidoniimonas polymericola]|uniref:DUF1844 domain-containing protein n=1 Tax=Posidoniimonas polymericola TaxID=2528002 RepID=A0A5C5YFE1_9BACT|nr:DUF1844 domain-containing protein [Posidoniimonas polymericola]TWT73513.1 hypothetical protein Pla123a_38490 [Posidoniimonas polymericola]